MILFFNLLNFRFSINNYSNNNYIPVYSSKIGPHDNPMETYPYFYLPFCSNKNNLKPKQSFSDVFIGNYLFDIGINLKFNFNQTSENICKTKINKEFKYKFENAIKRNFWIQYYIDDLPIWSHVGLITSEGPQIFSHLIFSFYYNLNNIIEINISSNSPIKIIENENIEFTFTSIWLPTNLSYKDRYIKYQDSIFFKHSVHFYSTLNSSLLVLLLIILVILTLNRVLTRDYHRFLQEAALDGFELDITIERGWKTLHGDVFRPPRHIHTLSILSGAGIHLGIGSLIYASINYFFDFYKGRDSLLSLGFLIFILSSPFSGLFSVSFGRAFGITKWLRIAFGSGFAIPSLLSGIVLCTTTLAYLINPSQAVPIIYLIFGALLIFLIILPLSGFGGYLALKFKWFEGNKCNFSLIPKTVPKLPLYLKWPIICLIIGSLCSTSIFIEVYYILTSIWQYKLFYVWGYLFIVILLVISVSATSTILLIYLLLQNEEYRWQWISFIAPSTTGIFVFIYSIYFYWTKTNIYGFFQIAYYVLYSGAFSVLIGLICGGVGFLSSNLFVHKIFKNLKID